ncbi:single-strand binding protein [Bartonella australis AUST/NH1]|uniref:Single-stranded DNA-binding protein n=1 Tax=Bartonella australis (strain Aust/NH1) TaxID=1094489 RepID=M1NU57_BARAA|nr:single-stranded DNA-binding protein [Bartonella australis]AGF74843.1 single-strand binding protein [Bartonella australis AUST/NH1]
MASGVNKVILLGNLGADPKISSLNSGDRVANLTLATSEVWKDRKTGEKRERVEWHNVVIFDERLVKLAEHYLKKGNKIYVEGQLQTRKWQDQSGNDHYKTEVVLKSFGGNIVLLETQGQSSSNTAGGHQAMGANRATQYTSAQSPFSDEIPF